MSDILAAASPWQEPDWGRLRARLDQIDADYLTEPCREGRSYDHARTDALRALVHERPELAIAAERDYAFQGARIIEDLNYERHARDKAALRRDLADARLDQRAKLASGLRAWLALQGAKLGKYRADGVRIAADWLDGGER